MMASRLVVWLVFCVFFIKNIDFIRCTDECKTHADCPHGKNCCGGSWYTPAENRPKRTCRKDTCLHNYCEKDSHCGDSSMCCISNKCVNKGCSGCTKNSDCYYTLWDKHVCCKKTFPFNETACGDDCIGQTCNSNDDCAGRGECCRSNKCVNTCKDKCTMNSECDSDKHCCKMKSGWFGDNCAKSCVGEYCVRDEDCGEPNVCCISNKCVDKGCSGCTKNSDCYYYSIFNKHVCCKKTFPFNETACGDDCIGQTCNSNDDCAGRGECCRSNKCVNTCKDKCTMNSECDSDKHCCKMKSGWFGDNCAKSCVGEYCVRDEDCGEPNVCCISNKCVDKGCSGCTKNSDCYYKHVCCKKTFRFNETACGGDCIGQTCNSNDDCAGRGECCRSNKCVDSCDEMSTSTPKSSFPMRRNTTPFPQNPAYEPQQSDSSAGETAGIAIVVLLFVVAVSITFMWYYKRKRTTNTTPVHRGTVSQSQGIVIENLQPSSGFNNPMQQQQGTGFALQQNPLQNNPQNYEFSICASTNQNNGGYVVANDSCIDRIYENPDEVKDTIQQQGYPQLYP